MQEYLSALGTELKGRLSDEWDLSTIYFGGGTPSRLGGTGIRQAIELIAKNSRVQGDAEITIEVNPDDVTPENALAWVDAGVNRISLGVQSFDPAVLEWMHRTHTASQSKTAVRILRESGIDNISVDLIFAIPPQLGRDWERDVNDILALDPSHISLYGLTAESSTPLGKWIERGDIEEASEERYEDDFMYAHHTLTVAGFDHYEVSNYALPGARSRHNSSYWKGVPYVGLGPSAHGYDGRRREWNIRHYVPWKDALVAGSPSIEGFEELTESNRNAERVYLGLRTSDGLAVTSQELAYAHKWIEMGWAMKSERTLVLTPLGWLRLDALASALTGIKDQ